MCYYEFVNIFIVLSLKMYENVNRFQSYILDLIKQTISNALHNTEEK